MRQKRRIASGRTDARSGLDRSGALTASLHSFGDGPIVADHDRYHELLAMAKIYHDWTQGQLADALGRDEHNLWPKGGILRMDIVVRLAEALDWPLHAVLEDLAFHAESDERETSAVDVEALNASSFDAFLEGRYADALRFARLMRRRAITPTDRARALLRQSLAWEALGRYTAALESLQEALAEPIVDRRIEMRLRCNLAWCHHALGQAFEGEGIATGVLSDLECELSADPEAEGWAAYARYVRGLCLRLRAEALADAAACSTEGTCPVDARRRAIPLASRAIDELDSARAGLRQVAEVNDLAYYRGLARICDGAILGLETIVGRISATECIEHIVDELDAWIDPASGDAGADEHGVDSLAGEGEGRRGTPTKVGIDAEAIGWWCVFGCHVVLREIDEPAQRDRLLAILSNKATEVAEATGNWSLRERIFTVEFLRRAGGADDSVLDVDDVRILSGVMGRFPSFRRLGWSLVRRAFASSRATR